MSVPNALTIDVEDYFQVAALAPNIHRDSWNSREPRVVGNTQRLLAIFEQFDVRGTFFVLGPEEFYEETLRAKNLLQDSPVRR